MKKAIVFSMVIMALFASCKKDDAARAKEYLKKAEQMLAKGNYNAAKLNLDSIHQLFPRLIPMRQAADTVMYRVVLAQSRRNFLFADSLLPIRKHIADSLLKSFHYEKDARYEDVGRYLYKTQPGSGITRTGIKAYVTELGELTIVSAYAGAPLGFTKTKVSLNDLFAETIVGSGDSRNSFSNQGNSWESVSYTDPEINGVDAFVANNRTAKLKVTLEGGKRTFSYELTQDDKDAIVQSYYLAAILKNVEQLKKDLVRSKQKIAIVCQHLRLNPQEQLPAKTNP